MKDNSVEDYKENSVENVCSPVVKCSAYDCIHNTICANPSPYDAFPDGYCDYPYYIDLQAEPAEDGMHLFCNTYFNRNKVDKKIPVRYLINRVCEYYKVSRDKVFSTEETADIVKARNVAMYICHEMGSMEYEDIGVLFGDRTETTVIHICKEVAEDPSLKDDLGNLEGWYLYGEEEP